MASLVVPSDGRPQFSRLAVMLANNDLGHGPVVSGFEQVGEDAYVRPFSPAPKAQSFSGLSVPQIPH
jgi:hypothetical protein